MHIEEDAGADAAGTVAGCAGVGACVAPGNLGEEEGSLGGEDAPLVRPGNEGDGVSGGGAGERLLRALNCCAVGRGNGEGRWDCVCVGGGGRVCVCVCVCV